MAKFKAGINQRRMQRETETERERENKREE